MAVWQTSNDPFDSLYADHRPSFLRRHGLRILGGIASSAVVAFIMHLGMIKSAIVWACYLVTLVAGKPTEAVKVEDRIRDAIAKGKQAAREHPGGIPGTRPPFFTPITRRVIAGPLAPVIAPVKEKIAKVEQVAAKAKAVEEKATKGVEVVKATGDKVKETGKEVVGAIKDMGGKAQAAVGGVGANISGRLEARAKTQEETLRAGLTIRARRVNLKIDESWSTAQLNAEVAEAERLWQLKHGPNAQCPYCRHGLRIKSKGAFEIRCPRCLRIFGARRARSLGPPLIRRGLFR
jgi:hypothetical protein